MAKIGAKYGPLNRGKKMPATNARMQAVWERRRSAAKE